MTNPTINLAALPVHLILQPVKLVPLPQHYRFEVSWSPGWSPPRRDGIGLAIGNEFIGRIDAQDASGSHGFNELLEKVLGYATIHDLWSQTVPCTAVASNASGSAFVAKSNPQTLRLPVRPLHDIAANQFAWNTINGDTPPPLALQLHSGRRLYRRLPLGGAASMLPKLWYVKPDNTLEDTVSGRGFDRLSFWQAVFGMSLKSTTNLKFEDAMAKLLNAHVAPQMPAMGKLGDLLAALPAYSDLGRCLMWTPTRFVCLLHHAPNSLFAMEFDAAGLHSEPAPSWLAKENPSTIWHYRRLKHPTPPPACGVLSLA